MTFPKIQFPLKSKNLVTWYHNFFYRVLQRFAQLIHVIKKCLLSRPFLQPFFISKRWVNSSPLFSCKYSCKSLLSSHTLLRTLPLISPSFLHVTRNISTLCLDFHTTLKKHAWVNQSLFNKINHIYNIFPNFWIASLEFLT